jgi:hypothetical protein
VPTDRIHVWSAAVVVLCAWSASHAASPAGAVIEIQLAGVNSTAFAVAGASAEQVASVIADLAPSAELRAAAEARAAVAERSSILLDAMSRPDARTEAGANRITDARRQRDLAIRTAELARATLMGRLSSTLPVDVAARIEIWRSTSASLPPELRVVRWTETESVVLQAALLQEAVQSSQGGAISPAAAATLADARARPEVQGAASRLQASGPAIQSVLDGAAGSAVPP